MRRFALRYAVLVAALSLSASLAACANNHPPAENLPPLSFADKPPIVLDVARIEIVSKYQAPSTPPHIELGLPVTPENAFRKWVQDRLQPRGATGTMRVVINNAAATETTLPQDNASMFNNQPQTKVDMTLDVSLEMLDDRQFVTADVSGHASRSETLFTDLKLSQRDRILYDMAAKVTNAVGDELAPRVLTTFHNKVMN